LYGIEDGGTLSEILHQPSFLGLVLSDMEEVSYIFWLGFYLFFAILIWHEFELGFGKAIAICCTYPIGDTAKVAGGFLLILFI